MEFRKEQLRKLRNVVEQNSAALIEAVYKDLRRPHATNMKLEVEAILKNIDYALAHLDEWAAQQKAINVIIYKQIIIYTYTIIKQNQQIK